MRTDIQQSLEALQMDYLDCLMLHEPRLTDPLPEMAEELRKCVASGTARRIGVGTGYELGALPRFGDVAQFALSPSLLNSGDPRALIVHGLFRSLDEKEFKRCAVDSGLMENIPSLRTYASDSLGISALILNAVILGTKVDRVLLSTSSVARLRGVLGATAAVFEDIRGAWKPEHESLFADTIQRYGSPTGDHGVHAEK